MCIDLVFFKEITNWEGKQTRVIGFDKKSTFCTLPETLLKSSIQRALKIPENSVAFFFFVTP